jgi:signal transduction histidine kinase
MSELVTESLAKVRLDGALHRIERVHLGPLLEEIAVAATMHATTKEIELSIDPVAPQFEVDGDNTILASILTNLIGNACKFTHVRRRVTVSTHVTADRVAVLVADACGGLPAGDPNKLFRACEQRGLDRSGLGLGLVIGRDLTVRDVPALGCIFTLILRRSVDA